MYASFVSEQVASMGYSEVLPRGNCWRYLCLLYGICARAHCCALHAVASRCFGQLGGAAHSPCIAIVTAQNAVHGASSNAALVLWDPMQRWVVEGVHDRRLGWQVQLALGLVLLASYCVPPPLCTPAYILLLLHTSYLS